MAKKKLLADLQVALNQLTVAGDALTKEVGRGYNPNWHPVIAQLAAAHQNVTACADKAETYMKKWDETGLRAKFSKVKNLHQKSELEKARDDAIKYVSNAKITCSSWTGSIKWYRGLAAQCKADLEAQARS
jgi:hypothetical protein